MKIAIIGSGWVGSHLSVKLKEAHDVSLFDENGVSFMGTSYYNQNRLHYGYHYARNHKTRELCKNTFYQFINDYGFCVSEVKSNFYCVPRKISLMDFETYLQVFNGYPTESINHNFNNTEGCILTNEKHINFKLAKEYFDSELKDIIIKEKITSEKLETLKNEFDLVIDCTNNFLGLINDDFFYELTLTLIYEKINETNYDSVTFVDGDLFSIYPYQNNEYTLTDVKLTPIKKFNNLLDLKDFESKINDDYIQDKVNEFENRVEYLIPDFKLNFKYRSYFTSVKSKVLDDSGNRYPVFKKEDNLISCFTGKIQGIYIIEDFINKEIKNYGS